MKIFLLFAAAVIILFAANPSKAVSDTDKKDNQPACCSKSKCDENEKANEPDDFFPIQFNPFHI
jgi:hypothetical protein